MTGQKGNGDTGQGGNSSESSCVTHAALGRNLGLGCVKTEEGPSNQLSHILCPLTHQEDTDLRQPL